MRHEKEFFKELDKQLASLAFSDTCDTAVLQHIAKIRDFIAPELRVGIIPIIKILKEQTSNDYGLAEMKRAVEEMIDGLREGKFKNSIFDSSFPNE